ncbi:MAG: bifunctional adenosylcobinamide kinase/adenosylcobinamide-phosphate guanylyltransferase [Gammaproteobacteria bacterium]|jgi:adenosylcobinamide kinase / adenosylcobinamide-phosphate guanylyltransferase|nr:bifunctional adenosylcobinamide kinase/adenosylcobinamide-phosphate guanylyltransferase [Gammaproteobacteria bacterium]MBT4491782.1 bifunctional adenosylcobinamide kinase/adenosylcobinamide-phosphate guanylyltransferase [Gammaproteobacteria bacterium]MBT7372207.1 bifunctional adenosylcobinamide kinase/adenosylcobinamide-phosphate guanylyltransferase [Gammaproteobacteria bacterium]
MLMLILGGARSGKSRYALSFGNDRYQRQVFVATSEPLDAEMQLRISKHQDERGDRWETHEVPIDLTSAIKSVDETSTLLVIDCLTLWLSNLMHYELDIEAEIQRLVECLQSVEGDYILVSNEVGFGIVPESALSREFRDHQGRLNQRLAAIADQVDLVVAGIPLAIKALAGNAK